MKNVILVDDEPMVLESIRAGIDWESLHLKLTAQFTSTADALDYVQRNPVDIAVIDVTMPPFNGLILGSRIQQLKPEVRFIMISGYADFAYAQKAMQFGAVGYCLKPINYAELCGYLKKAAGTQTAPVPALEFTEALYENNVPQMRAYLLSQGVREPFYLAACSGKRSLLDLTGGFSCSIGLNECLYFSDEKLPVLLTKERLAEKNAAGKELWGVAPAMEPITCEQLRDSAFLLIYDSCQSFFYPDTLLFTTHCTYCEELAGEVRRTLSQPAALIELLHAQKGRINHIVQAADICNQVYQTVGGEETLYTYRQLLFTFRDYDDMVRHLAELVRPAPGAETVRSSNKTFLAIIKYIHENYTGELSIKNIAEQFYMNPCYVSQLFKKETGETFVRYLTALRIRRAEELLTATNLAVNKISEECGFNDPFYFIRLFKRYTGHAPSDYRKQNAAGLTHCAE